MVNNKFTFILLVIILGLNVVSSQYIHMLTYDSTSCSNLLKVTSFIPGICYKVGTLGAVKATISGSTVTYQSYTVTDCTLLPTTTTYTANSTTCNNKLKFVSSALPIVPAGGKGYYEQSSNCNDNSVSQKVSMALDQCTLSNLLAKSSKASGISSTQLNLSIADLVCPLSLSVFSLGCNSNSDSIYNAFTVPTPSTITLGSILTPDYGVLSISGVIGKAWSLTSLTYQMEYQNITDGTWIPICTDVSNNVPCSVAGLPIGFETKIRANIFGVDYFNSLPSPLITSLISLPSLPSLPTLTLVNRYTNRFTVSYYSSTGGVPGQSTIFKVLFNSIDYSTSCNNNTCTIQDSLTQPGSSISVAVSAINFGKSSLVSNLVVTLYNSLTIPLLDVAAINTTHVKASFLASEGVPSLTRYTLYVDGSPSQCVSIAATECILSVSLGNHSFYVQAINDINVLNSLSLIASAIPVISTPELTVVSIGTTWVNISFSSIGGMPGLTLYTLTVAGTAYPSCTNINSTFCYVSGLTPGSTANSVLLHASNAGVTVSTTVTTFNTYLLLYAPIISISQSSNNLMIGYSSNGGIPDATTYDVWVNGTLACQATLLLTCTKTGVSIGVSYNVTVVANNDARSMASTSFYTTTNIYVVSTVSPGTHYANISFGYEGLPAGTVVDYTIRMNGIVVNTTTAESGTYTLIDLNPGYFYSNLMVSMLYNSVTYDNNNNQFTTYQAVSAPIMYYQQLDDVLNISMVATGGIPFQTVYSFMVNDTSYCSNTPMISYCEINLASTVGYGLLSISGNVSNDGYIRPAALIFSTYPPLQFTLPNLLPSVNSLYVEWGNATGGVPGETTYTVTLHQGTNNMVIPTCTASPCQIRNLLANTKYIVEVTVSNSDSFRPISRDVSIQTLVDSNTVCTLPCLNGGKCISGICDCQNGWTGQQCSVNVKAGMTTTMTADPSKSSITMLNQQVTLNFDLTSIIEVDSNNLVVSQLVLSSWKLVATNETIVTHPSTNEEFKKIQVTYETNSLFNVVDLIRVVFIQFEPKDNTTTPMATSFTVEFAGVTFSIPIGTLKYTITIGGWNFQSMSNHLELVSSISSDMLIGTNGGKMAMSNSTDMTMMSISDNNGNQIFANLMNRVVADNMTLGVTQVFDSPNTLIGKVNIRTKVPYFQSTLEYDPNLAVLTTYDSSSDSSSNDNNSSNSKLKGVYIGVIVGVIGGAVIIAAILVILAKNRTKVKILTLKMTRRRRGTVV